MSHKGLFALTLLSIISFLVACAEDSKIEDSKTNSTTEENKVAAELNAEQKNAIYQSEEYGITILQNLDWKFDLEEETENLNVMLSHNKLNAIISTVSAEKSFEDIKNELKAGAGDVEVVSEDDNSLSFKSKLKNAVRTDVYFKRRNVDKNLIIIFMSPVAKYEQAKPNIESLLNHINLK